MQEAAQKFRKYVCNVERDIEILVFEMLDLIDSKTRTLRKLMKLHQNVRRVSKITAEQAVVFSGKRKAPEKRHSSPSLTSNGNSMTENISITESTPYNASCTLEASEEDRKSGKEPLGAYIEATLEASEEDRKSGNEPEPDKPLGAYIEGLIDSIAKAAKEQEPQEENWAEALTRLRPTTPEIPHPNSPLHNSSYSSMHGRSIIVNLEGALNNLEGCIPGQDGVFLDSSVYRNVIGTLKTALASYGLMCSNAGFQEGPRMLGMGRSSTQPVLNVNVEDVVRRKTCSTTGCDKHARKKRY